MIKTGRALVVYGLALLAALGVMDFFVVPLGLFRATPALAVVAGFAIASVARANSGFALASGSLVVLLVLGSLFSDYRVGLAHPIGTVALIPVASLFLVASVLLRRNAKQ